MGQLAPSRSECSSTDSRSQASSEYKYQELQDRTMALLGKQELRLEAAFNNLSLGEAGQLSSHGTSDEGLRRADRGNHQAPIDKDRSSEGGRQDFSPKLRRRLQFCEEEEDRAPCHLNRLPVTTKTIRGLPRRRKCPIRPRPQRPSPPNPPPQARP